MGTGWYDSSQVSVNGQAVNDIVSAAPQLRTETKIELVSRRWVEGAPGGIRTPARTDSKSVARLVVDLPPLQKGPPRNGTALAVARAGTAYSLPLQRRACPERQVANCIRVWRSRR